MGTVRPATAPREKPISDDTDPRALRFLARETRTRATATTVRAEASNSPATIPLRSQSARGAPPRPPKRRLPEAILARAREEIAARVRARTARAASVDRRVQALPVAVCAGSTMSVLLDLTQCRRAQTARERHRRDDERREAAKARRAARSAAAEAARARAAAFRRGWDELERVLENRPPPPLKSRPDARGNAALSSARRASGTRRESARKASIEDEGDVARWVADWGADWGTDWGAEWMAERDRKPNEREDADANDDAKPRALTLAKPPVGTREASSSTVPAPVHVPIEAPVRAARALRDEVRAVFERGRKVKGSSDGAEGGARGRTPPRRGQRWRT